MGRGALTMTSSLGTTDLWFSVYYYYATAIKENLINLPISV